MAPRTCVSYCYHQPQQDPERVMENLKFFLEFGTTSHSSVDYFLILQGCESPYEIPKHVNVISSENTGFDLGAHGKVLSHLTLSHYDYFVFINCGARGPFLPAYWPKELHWTEIFTSKLKSQDKPGIVGPSLFFHKQPRDVVVETWTFALSYPALQTALNETRVFDLHKTKTHAVVYGEDRLTPFLTSRGFDVDCLLMRYQKHRPWTRDLKDLTAEELNNFQVPSRPFLYEDINIHPLECVFYKTHWRSTWKYDHYECPVEQRYTQWLQGESEPRPLVHSLDPRRLVMSELDPDKRKKMEEQILFVEPMSEPKDEPEPHSHSPNPWTISTVSLIFLVAILIGVCIVLGARKH